MITWIAFFLTFSTHTCRTLVKTSDALSIYCVQRMMKMSWFMRSSWFGRRRRCGMREIKAKLRINKLYHCGDIIYEYNREKIVHKTLLSNNYTKRAFKLIIYTEFIMKFMFPCAVNVKLNVYNTHSHTRTRLYMDETSSELAKSESYSAMHKLLLWELVGVNLRISPENMKLFPSSWFSITFWMAKLVSSSIYVSLCISQTMISHETIHFRF